MQIEIVHRFRSVQQVSVSDILYPVAQQQQQPSTATCSGSSNRSPNRKRKFKR